MSPSIRLIYLILLSLSLLSASFGVHELSQVPLGNIQGLAMVGIGILILAWMIIHPLQPLTDADVNSIQRRISIRFDPLAHTLLKRPLIYVGMLVGALALPLTSNLALQPWPILIIWATGILLFLVGTATLGFQIGIREPLAQVVEWTREAKWELLAVLALTGFAFLCRGIALGNIPHNVHGDEGEMGLLARAVLRGELREPFVTGFLGHPTLWFFMQALALRLFGDTIAGLRMLSALIGALAIPALYVFVRPLYGRAVAILAAILLAFYHFHIHYSRIGLNNIADPLMMLVTLATFFNGYRKRSLVSFALSGVLMGLAIIQVSFLLSQIIGPFQRLPAGFTAFIVGAFVLWNLYFYFDIYTPLNKYALNPITTDIGNYLHKQAGQSYAYMFTPPHLYLEYATIKFVANDPPGKNILDPLTSLTALQEPPAGLRPVFIFIPERLSELEVVKERYPNGELQEYSRPPNTEQIYLYIYEPR